MKASGQQAPGKSRQAVVGRKHPSRDPWVRAQEELACRRCGSTPGNQCTTSNGTFAHHPHLERYEDAGLASSTETTDRARLRASTRRRMLVKRAAVKQQVLKHYGEACACCRATENLVIDHISGGGSGRRHREEVGRAPYAIHMWLIKNSFPPGFQTLCARCNKSKHSGPYCLLHNQAGYEAVIAIIRTVNPGAAARPALATMFSERLAG